VEKSIAAGLINESDISIHTIAESDDGMQDEKKEDVPTDNTEDEEEKSNTTSEEDSTEAEETKDEDEVEETKDEEEDEEESSESTTESSVPSVHKFPRNNPSIPNPDASKVVSESDTEEPKAKLLPKSITDQYRIVCQCGAKNCRKWLF